ncbi:MAG: cytochrome C [Alphaproteobacteria bacterium]|nr:cytochrome C [Alphaproteobacteria bacterium]MBL7096318.1 cytochrome C [Alphaproteobacteria bacterium]
MRSVSSWIIGVGMLAAVTAALTTSAEAVPAFAEQTGQPCSACHVGAFGPQLTPFGRAFKLGGYTMRAGDQFTNPVSAMAIMSFLNTAKDQAAPPAPHYGVNNNATIDQISLFIAGGIDDTFGGFSQFTYDGVGRAFSWDNLDLRAVTSGTWLNVPVQAGLSLNNAPGMQDVWNTIPAWGFPYTKSNLAPAPAEATIFDGRLAQHVLGFTAYADWDSHVYTEASFYWSPGRHFLSTLGSGEGVGRITDVAPYLRVAWHDDRGDDNYEIGAFFFRPDLYPGGDPTTGTSDLYTDLGVDASYQYTGDNSSIYGANLRYTYEHQHLAATTILGGATNLNDNLNELNVDASYYWQNEIGGTVGFFDSWGTSDPLLYGASATGKPDSAGFIVQVDGTAFGRDMEILDGRFNVRLGLQYTAYTRFDGGTTNYDGAGTNASDNNTLRVFLWTAL